MTPPEERRQLPRRSLAPPEVAVLHDSAGPDLPCGRLFVDLLDRSAGGVLARSTRRVAPGARMHLEVYAPASRAWETLSVEVVHETQDPDKPRYRRIGMAFGRRQAPPPPPAAAPEVERMPQAEDYGFFRGIDLLRRIHRDAVCPLLNNIRLRRVPAGERFITQGAEGDAFYVIQRGTCTVWVEKNGESHRVAGRRAGDILGEMALLTGEPRSAHVDAETDVELWRMGRADFDRLLQEFPELRGFLTEIVADRFGSSRVTAERSIGKYLITDVIGRGGFSIVYKGVHTGLSMPVVIKMLNHDMAMDAHFRSGFAKEARIIARFNHENIIKVYDIEERFQTMFIVMELLEGRTLREILDEVQRLSGPETVRCLLQVSAGLRYAHARGVVHQDINPGNIFIAPGGRVKILDFGLAAPCGTESAMTGTPFYMSPEQVECLPIDERADIYALGITAYEMMAGRRPFPEDDPHAVLDMHVEQDIPDPAEAVAGIPEGLRRFILKACARDPEARYRNIEAVEADLRPLAGQLGVAAPAPSADRRKMVNLIMLYNDEHQLALNRLLEEFSEKIRSLGIALKVADFTDV
jgi:CRP-like cAMP-binding protein